MTIRGRDFGIRRFPIELPGATAGKNRAPRPDQINVAIYQRQHAKALAIIREQIDREGLLGDADGFEAADLVDEGLCQLFAGRVSIRVKNSRIAVTTLQAE